MKSRFRALAQLLTVASLFASLMFSPVAAQEAKFTGLKLRSFNHEGFVYEYTVNPGETVTGKFLAQHDFEDPNKQVKYYLLASDFVIDPDLGNPVYPNREFFLDDQFSMARWISFDRESISLSRFGQEEVINYKVTVPANAKPGSYYASLLLSDITAQEYREGNVEINTTGAALGSRLAPIVIVTVKGDLSTTVSINDLEVLTEDLQTPFLGIHEYLPVTFRTRLRNEGNYIVNPSGNVFVHTGDEGSPLATFKFNENANRLLPASMRPYFNTWDDANILFRQDKSFPGGGHLTLNTDKSGGFRMGRYFVTAKVRYKDQNDEAKLVTLTREFWVIPWKLILALVIAIGLVIYVMYRRATGDDRKSQKSKSSAKSRFYSA
jgi:hypothetical protein